MMDFIDFLKYGAIGISLALAVLSFRLLSKEQEKDVERPGFLKIIRVYMIFAMVLSIFFGVSEILVPFMHRNTKVTDIQTEIDTLDVCQRFVEQLNNCNNKLAEYDQGFYQNIIKLKKQLRLTPDGWTNLRFDPDSKAETFYLLTNIFKSLGYDYKNRTNKEMISEWESLKNNWTDDKLSYIFNSDITELIKIYLKTYEDN